MEPKEYLQTKYNELFKKLYKFDVNKTRDDNQPYDDARRIWDESIETAETLIFYRVNHPKNKAVDKYIASLINMYKYLRGSNDYELLKLVKHEAELKRVAEEMKKKEIEASAEGDMGVMKPLLTHVKAIAQQAEKLPKDKAFSHKTESLALITELMQKLEDRIADVSSKTAYDKASAITQKLEMWSLVTADSFESGEFVKDDILKPLNEALKIADDWAKSPGVTKKNSVNLKILEEFDTNQLVPLLMILESAVEYSDEQRGALNKRVYQNGRLISDIKKTLEALLAAFPQNSHLKAMAADFKDPDKLGRRVIDVEGAEYFAARMENEDKFFEFATVFSKELIRVYQISKDKKKRKLIDLSKSFENLHQIVSDWTESETKERTITNIGVVPMKLKTELIDNLSRTARELEKYRKYCEALGHDISKSEGYQNSQKASEAIKRAMESLDGALVSDTEENYELIDNVMRELANIRNKITAMGSSFSFPENLEEFEYRVDRLIKAPQTGKKLSQKHEAEKFMTEATKEDFKAGIADEIESANYVLASLKKTEDLITFMNQYTATQMSVPLPAPYDKNADAGYTTIIKQVESLRNLSDIALDNGDDLQSATLWDQSEELLAEAEEYAQSQLRQNSEEIKIALERISSNSPYRDILSDIKRIKTVFVSNGLVSYSVRAKVISENNFEDPSKLFQQYVNAINSGMQKEAVALLGVLKHNINTILENKQIAAAVKQLGGGVVIKDPAVKAKEPAKTQLTPEQQKAIDDRRKAREAARRKEQGETPVTETPEVVKDGEVTKINTESDPLADLLKQL